MLDSVCDVNRGLLSWGPEYLLVFIKLLFLLASLRDGFSLELCLEGQHPGVASSLLTWILLFCGHYLMKLQVEEL